MKCWGGGRVYEGMKAYVRACVCVSESKMEGERMKK